MKIESILRELKKDYLAISPSRDFPATGWRVLRKELEGEHYRGESFSWVRLRMTTSFALLALCTVAVILASQKALPGDLLYPVKVLSEKITNKLIGNPSPTLEERASEARPPDGNKSDEDSEQKLQESTVESSQESQTATKKTDESGDSEKNQEKSPSASDKSPDPAQEKEVKEILKEAPKKLESIEEEVKGVKEELPLPEKDIDVLGP